MASLKAVKPAGLAKEPAAKLSETATKPAAAKGGVKKAEQKPREPKKKSFGYFHVKSGEEQQAGGSQKLIVATGEMEIVRGSPSYAMLWDYESRLSLPLVTP
uniref:Uncharacterized protein n=2 Tax=Oryza TaxID=4527 RepID=A0A0E0MZV8_ORYRU